MYRCNINCWGWIKMKNVEGGAVRILGIWVCWLDIRLNSLPGWNCPQETSLSETKEKALWHRVGNHHSGWPKYIHHYFVGFEVVLNLPNYTITWYITLLCQISYWNLFLFNLIKLSKFWLFHIFSKTVLAFGDHNGSIC